MRYSVKRKHVSGSASITEIEADSEEKALKKAEADYIAAKIERVKEDNEFTIEK